MDRLTDFIMEETRGGRYGSVDVSSLTIRGGGSQLVGGFIFASAVARLLHLCACGRVDLLHLNVAAYGSFYRKYLLSRIARLFRVPYAVHIHSGRFDQFWRNAGPGVAARIDDFMRSSASVIVLGNVFRELVLERAPHAGAKVAVLPNATPRRPARIPAGEPDAPVRITFLGKLSPLKGVPELIDALGVLRTRSNWTATLAGNGDVEGSRRRIAELGLAGRVAVPGWQGPEEVERLLTRTDVLILPSHSEGLPMVVVEAFAAGIAVIATPVYAVGEVVQHERNGLLVRPGDKHGIAAALARLIDDPGLRRRLGERARQDHAERHDPEAYMERLISLWEKAALRPQDPTASPSTAASSA
jgi:glycosyltransferase involved in cell wall biosynthesis